MTRSIKWRLVSIFVLLVVIVMIVSGTLIVYQTREYEYESIQRDVRAAATSIQSAVISDMAAADMESAIIARLESNDVDLKGMKLFLLDDKGNVVYTQSTNIREKNFYKAQVMAVLQNKTASQFDEVELYGDQAFYLGYARGIKKDNQTVYIIYILASTAKVQEKISVMVKVIAIAILLAIVLSVVLSFLFSSFLTQPIIALTKKARDMAKGELNNPIQVYSDDEIGQLTTNFNEMAFSLNATLAQVDSEKNKMETVITHMTDGILVFDNFGVIIHVNPAAVRMLKVTKALTFSEIFKGKITLEFDQLLQQVEQAQSRLTIMVDSGYYSVDFAKYLDKMGATVGLICVIQDITEHKKLENMQKEFVANVSHELRTPLTTIKSYAETLLDGALEDKDIATGFLQVINRESDRMTTLIQDLLELSKLDNQKSAFKRCPLDLAELVFNSVESYRIHAQKKNQDLVIAPMQHAAITLGDSERIEQVLKNLLSNAVKYSGEHAEIHVQLDTTDTYHKISITDTGMGIPEEDMAHIFERFYRVDKARSRAMGGTGLGLAIAKEIMELHHGRIGVESVFGKGTTFSLYFPVEKE